MSKKRKLLISCPNCRSGNLLVRKATNKVANHPIYIKRGGIIINYGKSVNTEVRESKFWLNCLSCPYQEPFEDEEALKAEVGLIAWDDIRDTSNHCCTVQTVTSKKSEALPTIRKSPLTETS